MKPRRPAPPRKRPSRPDTRKNPKRFLWLARTAVFLSLAALLGLLAYGEMRTSVAQAALLSWYDRHIAFAMEQDATPHMRFPKYGPYNQRLGYSYLPYYIKALQADDFTVAAQMRASNAYAKLLNFGIYPIYRPKTVAGLTLYDSEGEKIYAASYPNHVFDSFEQIPPLLTRTLLYIENRELLEGGFATRNPVVEWNRFFYAVFGQVAHLFVHSFNAGGASTLATQTEKFRFSPHGQTGSGLEKLRQIASASLRVYLDGPDTRAARKQIALDYLNSTPLSARPGFGEINSIGDGLWAWFGIDLNDAITALNLPEDDGDALRRKAAVYRAALGLVLAQRRPSYYLQTNRAALDELIDATLDRLAQAGVISQALRDFTKAATLDFLPEAPPPPAPPYIEQKAVNALRAHLLDLLGIKNLYELDRIDLSAHTTLDGEAERKLVDFLRQMDDKDFLQAEGLYGFRLLKPENDLSKIKWSVVLYERAAGSDKIRLQADTIDGPFDMNDGMKLDLGSTAKLRTLVTYLEIISELHRRYAGLDADDLQDMTEDAPDALTKWAIAWLAQNPDADTEAMLKASLERRYSANPNEVFFTGSGDHIFHNFEHEEDHEIMDMHEAFRRSVNLVFVRVMRDIVNYTIAQGPQTKAELLGGDDEEAPVRRAYLERFADQEGATFLNRYIKDYADLTPQARLEKLAAHAHKGAVARAVLFRTLYPDAGFETYAAFMQTHALREPVSAARLAKLYRDYAVDRFSLSDRAYLTGVNPMELWLLAYWQEHPQASRRALLDVSRPVRIESYAWLFKASKKRAQDTRIRIMLEEDAFAHIQKRWARLGYPFAHLVPSYATAIGSSADRPGALAELVGIILAGGRKLPVERFESLTFGQGTPYQTELKHNPGSQPQQVLSPAIAHIVKEMMSEVVDNGTARRARGAYRDADGNPIPVGGKTGTGDQRYDEFGAGGHLLSSRVVNRTGTFVFYIGDRFFGTITAHVAGEDAANYAFTSALSAQMLRDLAPIFNPLVNAAPTSDNPPPPTDSSQPLPP
ncbi:MAG: transglycosylase domain-containing protein [Alphaproteobacteria bacterium]|nr:transglycosylase domain-containing protein [Alphaproteobacteria bacterium]